MKFHVNCCFVIVFCVSFSTSKSFKKLRELKKKNETIIKLSSDPEIKRVEPQHQSQINKNTEHASGLNTKPGVPVYYAYEKNEHKNLPKAEERSSYISYGDEKVVPVHQVEAPEGGYQTQLMYGDGHGVYKTEIEEDDKEEYFYYKAKYIVKLIYALFAIEFALFAANVLYASIVATAGSYPFNLITGRRKRDTSDEDTEGGLNFGNSISCVAKFLCELEQMEDLFGVKRVSTTQSSKRIQDDEEKQGNQVHKEEAAKSSRRRRRRQRRQLFGKRDCANIYDTCSINFSLLWTLWKFLL